MNYTIKDHGDWARYVPDDGKTTWMYCKRVEDGIDWYDYSDNPTTNFDPKGVKIALLPLNDSLLTTCVSLDQTLLFPQGCTVIEVLGWEGEKPHNTFGNCTFDPETGEFTPLPPPVIPTITQKADIWRRCTDAEAITLSQILANQSIRKQLLFNDCSYLDHTDPLFLELKQGMLSALSETRVAELLAPS